MEEEEDSRDEARLNEDRILDIRRDILIDLTEWRKARPEMPTGELLGAFLTGKWPEPPPMDIPPGFKPEDAEALKSIEAGYSTLINSENPHARLLARSLIREVKSSLGEQIVYEELKPAVDPLVFRKFVRRPQGQVMRDDDMGEERPEREVREAREAREKNVYGRELTDRERVLAAVIGAPDDPSLLEAVPRPGETPEQATERKILQETFKGRFIEPSIRINPYDTGGD